MYDTYLFIYFVPQFIIQSAITKRNVVYFFPGFKKNALNFYLHIPTQPVTETF